MEAPAIDFTARRGRGAAPTLVQQVVDAITAAVASQVLRPGMALPSVRAFARAHDVSTFTVAAAYARLVATGVLEARAGAGYRVARPAQAGLPVPAPRPWEPPTPGAQWLLSDVFADHSIPVKSGCGWLPPQWLNEAGLHLGLRHVARLPGSRIAGYGHPYGYAPLREVVAQTMATLGLTVQPEQVLLTQGATHGLDLAIRTLLRPGDAVVVERPCYANLLPLLRLAGLRILAAPRGPGGVDIEALERLARDQRPRALFINTALQNPTGTSLPMANAFQILRVAEAHDFWVIEDDISRELARGAVPVLAALDGARRVVYLGGYSKVVSPSVRVGFVVAHADVVRDLARTKMAAGLTSPEIMERVVYQAVREGRYHAHLVALRDRLAGAHARVIQRLDEHGMQPLAQPGAGLFLWVPLAPRAATQGANALAERALQDGIWLAPGSYFDAEQHDTGWIRLNVAYSDDPALWRFLRQAGVTAHAGTARS